MLVRKRDGRLQEFSSDKILESIKEAALAVEGKDNDIQNRQNQINSMIRDLVSIGIDPDEAELQAEEEFDSELEDGIYTEYNEEEAIEVLNIVTDAIDALDMDILDTSVIQELVEKALMSTDHKKTAKEYIIKGNNRSRVREMNTSLMKSYEDLTFGNSKSVEKKRENANIDGDSAMGTMLKYGSEGAKKFNLLYLISPDIAEAHSKGDIHLHDLDFFSLTETCVCSDTKLIVKYVPTNDIRVVRADFFDKYLNNLPDDSVVKLSDFQILSYTGFTNLINCVRHSSIGKNIVRVSTNNSYINVTDNHKISISNNGMHDVKVSELKTGYKTIGPIYQNTANQRYINLIDLFGKNENIIIYNWADVVEYIRQSGHWDDFCSQFGYTGRDSNLRYGKNKANLKEYIERVRNRGYNIDESSLKLDYKRTRGEESINAVLELTTELGSYIGYMISEGSVTIHKSAKQDSPEKKACFTNSDSDLINDFNRCTRSIFNNAVIRDRVTNGVLSGTTLSGYLTYELFHGPFGIKNSTGDIRLAEWIYSANSDFFNGFIGALIDGDGYVQKDGYRIGYATASVQLATDLKMLLAINGIRCNTRIDKNKGTIANFGDKQSIRKYDTYHLEITHDRIKLANVRSKKVRDLLNINSTYTDEQNCITNIAEINYSGYVYDFETADNHFFANGILVHNCCQIDLEKLFNGGFNTGHGFLREPGEIRSYGALACIAIQSDQNDQHGGQSIPNFDHYMAPGVAKSFVKNIYKIIDIKYPECSDEALANTDKQGKLSNEDIKRT